MSNIQIDTTIQDNAIKSNYEVNHKLTPIALPHSDSDHDESSNNSKKSRRFILNNMLKTSPKLKSSYDTNKLTIKEQISLYQSLSNTDKNNFLIKNYSDNPNSLYEMYSNMASDDANAFLSKASVVLSNQIIQDYENLPNDDKQIVNSAAHKMIASMINSMPKDKKDEFTANLNKILNAGLNSKASSKGKSDPSTLIDIQDGYNGDFTPHAIPIMALIVKAFVGNMNTESLDELEQILKADMVNKFLDSVKNQINDDIQKYKDLEKTSSTQSKGMKIFSIVLLVVTVIAVVAMIALTGGAAAPEVLGGLGAEAGEGGAIAGAAAGEAAGAAAGEATEAAAAEAAEAADGATDEAAAEAESGKSTTPKDNSASTEKADSKWNRLKKWSNSDRVKTKLGNAFKKVIMPAVVVYGVGYMVNSTFGKNGQVKQQAELGEYQSDVQASTVQSDTLNNAEQTDSKRIDDDSQRISQSSGYCQQAINMLAQAMSMRA